MIGGEVTNPRIHAKCLRRAAGGAGEGRHTTLTHKSTVWLDLAALSWAFLFGRLMCIATQKYHNIYHIYINMYIYHLTKTA